ncbi:gluconate:H+ symporter [Glutamicibacter sp.]|uniref:gluconate:H+ symporter n=1 Tax=Glutamicibacter sp. TaxID=1931995 RepID=UPI0028BDCBDE|nr:gluconate:H+ symporter [Glutamicibacter sp.]
MPLVVVGLSVIVLLVLMMKFKLNGFISLLVVSVLVAFWAVATGSFSVDGQSAGLGSIPEVIKDGIGSQMGGTAIVVGLGAMIGRVMGDAGAAQRIAGKILGVFGERGVQWAMIVSAMLIGVTMFYEVAFVILVPVAFTLVRATKVNLLWVGLPMSISLSTMHSFLPPHPGPTAVAGLYEASVGLTLAYGLLVAVPVGAALAMIWPRLPFVRRINPTMPQGVLAEREFAESELPSGILSFLVAALPIIFIAGSEITLMSIGESEGLGYQALKFIGSPEIALLAALIVATIAFGPMHGRTMSQVGKSMSEGARAMAMIMLVIGAGGVFKEVLVSAGISDYIAQAAGSWNLNPIILAWLIAVILRIALGSATVAVSTAAGIAAPLVAASGISPELMVLATSCGSLAFSHVNDPGFWMFKEYFNLNVGQALAVRTSYTTVLSVLGLGGVLLLSLFIG